MLLKLVLGWLKNAFNQTLYLIFKTLCVFIFSMVKVILVLPRKLLLTNHQNLGNLIPKKVKEEKLDSCCFCKQGITKIRGLFQKEAYLPGMTHLKLIDPHVSVFKLKLYSSSSRLYFTNIFVKSLFNWNFGVDTTHLPTNRLHFFLYKHLWSKKNKKMVSLHQGKEQTRWYPSFVEINS